MRKRLCAISLLGLVAASSASAQTPVAEPQQKPRMQPVKPGVGEVKPANASAGASALRETTPEDASAAHEREMDERRATESKQKMKKRPGYREQVPLPRV